MTTINFKDAEGNISAVEAEVGESVMQVAMNAGIDGILADCGGGCSCATCHCYVEPGTFPEADEIESEMLECVLEPKDNSRLSCQLVITSEMESLVIELPENQI